jgi:hypothetical protein
METFRRATSAGDAFCAINAMAIFIKNMATMRADHRTVAALDTLMGKKCQLRFRLATLRIVTPTTPQWTAFQKNGRPNARSVMHRKTLDINQSAIYCHILSCFMKIYHAFSL